jgi:hypothetical protein
VETAVFSMRYLTYYFVQQHPERRITTWQVQARPFTALQWQATMRLAVFAESAVEASHQHKREDLRNMQTFNNGEQPRFSHQYSEASQLRLVWRPVQLLGLAYKL